VRNKKTKIIGSFLGLIVVFSIVCSSAPVFATVYGVGDYGECPYSVSSTNCDISISNNGFTLFLNVTPSVGGSCTIQSDQVTVDTYDPNGFTLTLGNTSTNTALEDVDASGNNIPATSGTLGSPTTLSDTWGYRVDGVGSFGSGPTSAVTNTSPSSLTFAQVEASGSTPDTITNTSSLNNSVGTTVWYGVCLDDGLNIPNGTYSSTVQYTATAN